MKTRILLTVMMMTLTTCFAAGSKQVRGEDSLYAFFAAVTGLNGETVTAGGVYNYPAGFMPSAISSGSSDLLEDWMESRESWEQENAATVYSTETLPVDLEGWITSLDNWEDSDTQSVTVTGMSSSFQEEWIADMDAWEQK